MRFLNLETLSSQRSSQLVESLVNIRGEPLQLNPAILTL